MTSPLHKKRPITAPSTTPAKAPSAAAPWPEAPLPSIATHQFSAEPIWLPAGLLAVLLTLTLALSAFGAPQPTMQWRPAGSHSAAHSKQPFAQPVPQRAAPHRDSQIQLVQFSEVAGPQLGSAPHGVARVEGLVDVTNGGATLLAQDPQLTDELKKQLATPFGGAEELPEQPAPTEPQPLEPAPFLNNDEPKLDNELDNKLDTVPDPDAENADEEIDPFEDEPALKADDEKKEDPKADPKTPGPKLDAAKKSPTASPDIAAKEAEKLEKERQESSKRCSESWEQLKASRLASVNVSIGITGVEGKDYPFECGIDDGTLFEPRCWPQVTYMWKASALCHKPLYFEDEGLERYGHSCRPCLQPFVSGAHFFLRIPVLPYCMGITPPNECVYALGHYRPGNCAPYMIDPIPFTWRAAFFQAGATVGAAAILP